MSVNYDIKDQLEFLNIQAILDKLNFLITHELNSKFSE